MNEARTAIAAWRVVDEARAAAHREAAGVAEVDQELHDALGAVERAVAAVQVRLRQIAVKECGCIVPRLTAETGGDE